MHRLRTRGLTAFAMLLSAGGALPVYGFERGARAGYSGSPASISMSASAGSCTACHDFGQGPGAARLIGVPSNYSPSAVYEIVVRIADPSRLSAGFELSVENGPCTAPLHQGSLSPVDSLTDFASNDPNFLTQTQAGADDAAANWAANGYGAEFLFQWQAPPVPQGLIRFFVVGMAVDLSNNPSGDHMYLTTAATRPIPAGPGDADHDGDVDLSDFEVLAGCWSGPGTAAAAGCDVFDLNADLDVDLLDYAAFADVLLTGTIPVEFANANGTRGGLLYDRWWAVNGAPPPAGDHPLYPPAGAQSGEITFRCKECHGWDYQGAAGAYGSGTHYTGIPGILGTELRPQELFDLLKYGSGTIPDGHGMASSGMSDQDLWDVTRFVLTELLDTDDYIDGNGAFLGNIDQGLNLYYSHCDGCHGPDGTRINFGTPLEPEYVGTVAAENPWEFMHKVRFGHPGATMPSLVDLFAPNQDAADVGTYAQTLPTQ